MKSTNQITRKRTDPQSLAAQPDRYLVQFRDRDQDYLKTDCAFQNGQLHLAKQYVRTIVDTLDGVSEGQVLDVTRCISVYRYA